MKPRDRERQSARTPADTPAEDQLVSYVALLYREGAPSEVPMLEVHAPSLRAAAEEAEEAADGWDVDYDRIEVYILH